MLRQYTPPAEYYARAPRQGTIPPTRQPLGVIPRISGETVSERLFKLASEYDRLADSLALQPPGPAFRLIQEAAGCGALALLSDRLPARVLARDEWYNDFVLRGGVRDVLGTKLHENESHMVIVGLHRAIGDTRPIPDDAVALRMIMAPMQNAARLHLGLISSGFRSAITRDRLDHLHAGVVFTDASGRIIETNQAGEAILRLGDGLTMHSGQICARRKFETTKLAHLIANATAASEAGLSAGCMLIARDGGLPSYVVRVAPVRARSAGYNLPAAMILVSVPDESFISERELADLYGLSPAESRLAIALARGKRLTGLVSEFGVQITTLRTQLRAILKKFDVERQSDIVRVISHIPAWAPSAAPGPREEAGRARLGDSSLKE